MRKLIHLSDLHFDHTSDRVVKALKRAVYDICPDVVAVSGDLTQRARAHQFQEAAAFLGGLDFPRIVVPGNHDIPLLNPIKRFRRPFGYYQAYINEDLEPCFEDEELVVSGLCTPHPNTIDSGKVRSSSIEKLKTRFERARDKLKVVVCHHPLDLFGREMKTPRIKGRIIVQALLPLVPDLILSGHIHSASAWATASLGSFHHRSFILVQCGTSTSTRYRGQPNSFNQIELEKEKVQVIDFQFDGESRFRVHESHRFALSKDGWASVT